MKTVSIEVEDAAWEAAEKAAREANTDVKGLVQDYLVRVAEGTAPIPTLSETASRMRLLELLKECNIALDGRPTRESFYTDRRFH
jgi:hypothetical protein